MHRKRHQHIYRRKQLSSATLSPYVANPPRHTVGPTRCHTIPPLGTGRAWHVPGGGVHVALVGPPCTGASARTAWMLCLTLARAGVWCCVVRKKSR